jgi:hypothetical protein
MVHFGKLPVTLDFRVEGVCPQPRGVGTGTERGDIPLCRISQTFDMIPVNSFVNSNWQLINPSLCIHRLLLDPCKGS